MSTEPKPSPDATSLKRTFAAPPELVWELMTTAAGLAEWWGPEGFSTVVSELELRPGGAVRYEMTATAPEQVAFVQNLGLPLTSEFHRRFTEVTPLTRIAYSSLIDFVPGQDPYEHLTVIDIEPAGDRTIVLMTLDPLHDEPWTQEYREHRARELDNLDAALSRRMR